jgi:hypothetical protein
MPIPPVDPVVLAPADYPLLLTSAREGAERVVANVVEEVVGPKQSTVQVEQIRSRGRRRRCSPRLRQTPA